MERFDIVVRIRGANLTEASLEREGEERERGSRREGKGRCTQSHNHTQLRLVVGGFLRAKCRECPWPLGSVKEQFNRNVFFDSWGCDSMRWDYGVEHSHIARVLFIYL